MPKVLLLHTGGTLGMSRSAVNASGKEVLEPGGYSAHLLDTVPELAEIATLDSRMICDLDSSDIGPEHWANLAETIAREYANFDGFVVIHGTDTMAFTASALSFALQGLGKPVILTGAQRPLAELRTDARRNLADAVELATHAIPEVAICFDGLLLRGCRSSKSNTHDYRAFDSPGCLPLARMGVDIELGDHIRSPSQPFECDARFDENVVALSLTPGTDPRVYEALFSPEAGVKGIVLSAFGGGTAPSKDPRLAQLFASAYDRGVEIVAITNSAGSINLEMYRNSAQLLAAGVMSGGSMQVESAVTKLMHALAVYPDRSSRRRYMEWNVAGEIE